MDVTTAVTTRRSIRRFTDQTVDETQLRSLLETASRAPSGGNLQPWRIAVITAATMPSFLDHVRSSEMTAQPEYDVYPKELPSPYRDSRFKVGEDMYALLEIPREDKPARFANLMRNFEFFGAPVGMFCFVDRRMGPPQWSDLGMFLQTFMLLATEAGLSTCAQEAWAAHSQAVGAFLETPEELMLFCGMAIGYADDSEPVNTLVSDREPLDVWARFV